MLYADLFHVPDWVWETLWHAAAQQQHSLTPLPLFYEKWLQSCVVVAFLRQDGRLGRRVVTLQQVQSLVLEDARQAGGNAERRVASLMKEVDH